jgi:flagella basal body P-ring formation protein FlgA
MLRPSLIAAAFSFAMPAIACAFDDAPLPALRADVVVTADIVRIGDLLEHAGPAAKIAIFRSPDLGQTGTVKASRVLEAIRPHASAEIETRGLTEISVTRASRSFSVSEIEQRILGAFAGQRGFGHAKDLLVTFDRDVRPIQVEASAGDLQIARAIYDASTTRFDVSFEIPGSIAAKQMRLRYTGTLVETVEAAMLMRPLGRGDVIKASDVVIERKPRTSISAGALDRLQQVAGLAARRPLEPGQPLRAADLMKPESVRQNENVTITYEMPGLTLTMRGKALESGSDGDLVNVLNAQSKRTVQGVVSGPGRVTLVNTTAQVLTPDEQPTGSIAAKSPRRAE